MLPLGRFPVLRSGACAQAFASIRSRHQGLHAFRPLGAEASWRWSGNWLDLARASVLAVDSSPVDIVVRDDGLIRVFAPFDRPCLLGDGHRQRLVHAGEAACVPADFSGVFEDGFRGLIAAVSKADLAVALRAFDSEASLSDRLLESLSWEQAGLHAFRRQLQALVRAVDEAPEQILDQMRFRAAHEELLLLHLAQALAPGDGGAPPGVDYLSRALDFIHAHLFGEIGPVAIADAAGCSLRTLQLLFRREFGQTITETVRRLRLQHARNRLLQPDEGDTITSVALDCGFSHLSDFARHYRRAFGERPSQTLANARGGGPG